MSDEEKIVEKIAKITIACHRVLARKILQFCCARRFSGRVEEASRAVQDPLVPRGGLTTGIVALADALAAGETPTRRL